MSSEELSVCEGSPMDVTSLPFMFQLNQIHSGFVQVSQTVSTCDCEQVV